MSDLPNGTQILMTDLPDGGRVSTIAWRGEYETMTFGPNARGQSGYAGTDAHGTRSETLSEATAVHAAHLATARAHIADPS